MKIILLLLTLGVLGCGATTAYDKEIEEAQCKSEYPAGHNINYFDLLTQTPHEGWLVTMSNTHLAYHTGVQITGNDSLSEDDMKKTCLRISHKGVFSHHNVHSILVFCNITSFHSANCYFTHGKPHPHIAGKLHLTLVWTDEHSHNFLLVLCALEAKQPYWLLMSKTAVVESKVETKVLSVITDLGFDRKKVLYHDQSKCIEVEKDKHHGFLFG